MSLSVPNPTQTHETASSEVAILPLPSPELGKAYELSYFVNTFLHPFRGELAHFSQVEKDENKTVVQSKYFIWINLSYCKQTDPGFIKQNIKLFGLDLETNLERFLQTREVPLEDIKIICDLDILQDGNPAFNKTICQITLLTNDFFQRQKNTESALSLILPRSLYLIVQRYIS